MKKKILIVSLAIASVVVAGSIVFFAITTGKDETPPTTPDQQTTEQKSKTKSLGSDYTNAIKVTANTESTGIAWEYDWLEKNACWDDGGYSKPAFQELRSVNNHWYDVVTAECKKDDQKITYYFLIDNYFGKF